MTLGLASCAIGAFLAIMLAARALQASARANGFKDGYAKGRTDADNWWLGVEEQADEEQRNVWREEVHRGRIRRGRDAA